MAPNVFGDPITDETLKALPEYAIKETITSEDTAQVALNRKLPIPDIPVNVLGYINNATRHTLKLVYDHDWSGHVDESLSYPQKIENGQWGSFLHIGDYPPGLFVRQSTAAVVYYANNGRIGGFCKLLFAWHSGGFIGQNKVFTVLKNLKVLNITGKLFEKN
ncbi:23 kDa jasmonate-induced protein [Ziziphus jujuba]|uniref:23 kDa jasmonate-induced protein n=1 Tax=Ziziphus jujuba TaxID=326968 RepID=A0ABM3IHE4_ZIZJJ|nr:23 kDa jasmonate-induced protein [Ziziphus jujuba]